MGSEQFNEILDFAIEREEQAVRFYQALQAMASFDARKQMLNDFEKMEQGHAEILRNIKQRGEVKAEEVPDVQDLHIAEYVVEGDLKENMTFQEIIILAMKREEKAYNLYTRLAKRAGEGETKVLFDRLAGEEAKHKLQFEKIYDDEVLTEN